MKLLILNHFKEEIDCIAISIKPSAPGTYGISVVPIPPQITISAIITMRMVLILTGNSFCSSSEG